MAAVVDKTSSIVDLFLKEFAPSGPYGPQPSSFINGRPANPARAGVASSLAPTDH